MDKLSVFEGLLEELIDKMHMAEPVSGAAPAEAGEAEASEAIGGEEGEEKPGVAKIEAVIAGKPKGLAAGPCDKCGK